MALVSLIVFGPAKADAAGAPFPPPGLATVRTGVMPANETFAVRVTDPVLLDEMWAIANGMARSKIVGGRIRTGNDGYNRDTVSGNPWSWHLEEDSLYLADLTIEVCDGLPSMVEAYILGFGWGRFCPWTSQVISVVPAFGIDADTNVDGVVDQTDADKVAACFTAVGQSCVDIMPSCCQADIDADLDVDCSDWAAIEDQWTAAGVPTPPQPCAASPVPALSTPWLCVILAVALGIAGLSAARRRACRGRTPRPLTRAPSPSPGRPP